jgi:hypothetical protein
MAAEMLGICPILLLLFFLMLGICPTNILDTTIGVYGRAKFYNQIDPIFMDPKQATIIKKEFTNFFANDILALIKQKTKGRKNRYR